MRLAPLFPVLVAGLVVGCAAQVVTTPAPSPVAGNRIRYATRSDSTQFVPARFVSLDADSLVFERFVPGDRPRWAAGSVPADSLAGLQVRVGRRRHPVRGALIGAVAGGAVGILCAGEEGDFVTPEQCFFGYTILGAGTGLLIGTLVTSDVWAPTAVPARVTPPASQRPPAVSAVPVGVGWRLPIRLSGR